MAIQAVGVARCPVGAVESFFVALCQAKTSGSGAVNEVITLKNQGAQT